MEIEIIENLTFWIMQETKAYYFLAGVLQMLVFSKSTTFVIEFYDNKNMFIEHLFY